MGVPFIYPSLPSLLSCLLPCLCISPLQNHRTQGMYRMGGGGEWLPPNQKTRIQYYAMDWKARNMHGLGEKTVCAYTFSSCPGGAECGGAGVEMFPPLIVIISQQTSLHLLPALAVPSGTSHRKERQSSASSQLWHPLEIKHMCGLCSSFQLYTELFT